MCAFVACVVVEVACVGVACVWGRGEWEGVLRETRARGTEERMSAELPRIASR